MLKRKNAVEFHDEISRLYFQGMKRGASTGWPSIDEHYTVGLKQWTVVTGAPGHGKSEWLDALTLNLVKQGWQMIYFSPENQPHELHIVKQLEKWIGKPFSAGPTDRMKLDEANGAMVDLLQSICFLTVDAEFARVPSVIEVIHTVSEQVQEWRNVGMGKRVGIVLDPWNEFDHARPATLTETEYVSQTLSMIRQFARDWNLHIWLVAHPTKLQKKLDGTYPVARLWDISGSAHFANKADNGITVHRDYETGRVTVHILKVRFKHIGKVGSVELDYDKPTGRYFDHAGTTLPVSHKMLAAGEVECPI